MFLVPKTIDISKKQWKNSFLNILVEHLMVGVTIFICAVPEGLPLAVTLSLGFSMKWMVKDNIFVRHLNSCETMGSATTICSDKTGTLTQNNMTVVKFFICNNESDNIDTISIAMKELLAEAISINTSAYICQSEDGTSEKFVGQSSEVHFFKWFITRLESITEKCEKSFPLYFSTNLTPQERVCLQLSTATMQKALLTLCLKGALTT